MSEHGVDSTKLEQQLAELSAWNAPAPELWKRTATIPGAGTRGMFGRPLPRVMMSVAATIALLVLGAGFVLSNLPKAVSMRRVSNQVAASMAFEERGQSGESRAKLLTDDKAGAEVASLEQRPIVDGMGYEMRREGAIGTRQPPAPPVQGESGRQVIRKAMMEMTAKDVRTTFAKVPLILSEAQGEFVQESSMIADAREPDRVTATVVVRVAASRLSKVLAELRELGKVTNESAGGEDVTDQMVDLDARLRNEQRVEKELLGLMDTRKDSPLKEVMELRSSLDSVRQNIERMMAQRERLGRLVSLATVMVVIRCDKPDAAPAAATPVTLGDKFKDAAKHGWESLMGSVLWAMETAIAGMMWWIVLGAMGIAAWRGVRGLQRAAAKEPAPTA